MNHATDERPLTTADLAATDSAQRAQPDRQEEALRQTDEPMRESRDVRADMRGDERGGGRADARVDRDEERQLAPLFVPEAAADFRSRWDAIQIGFVDDPKLSVRSADELVAQVMKTLAETFSRERNDLEAQFKETEDTSTENLRVALCRYRSFFQRLLSL